MAAGNSSDFRGVRFIRVLVQTDRADGMRMPAVAVLFGLCVQRAAAQCDRSLATETVPIDWRALDGAWPRSFTLELDAGPCAVELHEDREVLARARGHLLNGTRAMMGTARCADGEAAGARFLIHRDGSARGELLLASGPVGFEWVVTTQGVRLYRVKAAAAAPAEECRIDLGHRRGSEGRRDEEPAALTTGPSNSLRTTPRVAGTTTCSVALDLRSSFVSRWGGYGGNAAEREARAVDVAIAAVYGASSHLEQELGLRLRLASVHVMDNDASWPSQGGTLLNRYELWLGTGADGPEGMPDAVRGAELPAANTVCANLLLADGESDVGGMANVASADSNVVGGMCERYMWPSDDGYRVLNTLFANTNAKNVRLSMSELQTVLLHEFGHLFGARHVCSNDCSVIGECNPSWSDGGPFVMFPSLSASQNSVWRMCRARRTVSLCADSWRACRCASRHAARVTLPMSRQRKGAA